MTLLPDKIKEKGDELIGKFRENIPPVGNWNYNAIQCAIIAVEEIISVYNRLVEYSWKGQKEGDPQKFWNEVLNYLKTTKQANQ